ncbi:AAA family ATPase [Streptomyces beijiangensis]|uniref:AAA family ATPase n=1 Tax=Streptomyces beijiangensis TaxID=163361 RepID=A0A939FFM3_9ACTN|nr:AAA family ATPase [Streptomyces beijiangensis]
MFAECLHGNNRIALVSGPLGSGKSALLRTFADQAALSGAVILGATASRTEQVIPFGVLAQLLHSAERSGLGSAGTGELLRTITESAAVHGSADEVPGRLFHQLCMGLMALAERATAPVLIGVDDVQYADAATLRCLSFLTRRLEACRLLIVLNESVQAQPARALLEAEMPSEPLFRRIQLPLLSPLGVESMVAARLGRRTARELRDEAHRVSGGNPLILGGLAEDSDVLVPATGVPTTDVPVLAVGTAYRQALIGCLYRGEPATLALAQALAVLDTSATPELAGQLARLDADATRRTAGALTATGILDEGRLRHTQARDAVLCALGDTERAALHSRAAELLFTAGAPTRTVARHLLAGERPVALYAVAVLQEAAADALDANEVAFALDCLRLARQTGTDADEQAVTAAMLARTEWRSNPHLALRYVPELTSALRTGRLSGPDIATPVNSMLWFGQAEGALGVLRLANGSEETGGPASSTHVQASRMWLSTAYPEAGRARPDAPAGALASRSTTAVSPHLQAAILLRSLMRDGPGERLAHTAERLLHKYRLCEQTVGVLQASVLTLLLSDRLATAERWSEPLLAEAKESNAPTWQAQFTALRAEIHLRRGELLMAANHARTALKIMTSKNWGVCIGFPLSTLLQAETALGRPEETLAEHLRIPLPHAMYRTPVGLAFLQARGRQHLAAGRSSQAYDDFQAVGEQAKEWQMDIPALVPWRTDAAQASLSLGLRGEAAELAWAQLARCAPEHLRIRAVTLRVIAACSRPEERPQLLVRAVESLQQCDDPYQLAHPLYDLGWTHQVSGRPAGSRPGTPPPRTPDGAADQTVRALSAPGPQEPAAALSEAEHRVASLAARGHSNRQIADRLFVTISTVEQHLTRAYKKLHVKRRAQLALLLRAGGEDSAQAR